MFNSHFLEKNYREAINDGFATLPYGDSVSVKRNYRNIEAAYVNFSRQQYLKKEYAAGDAILRECIEKIPECVNCRERLKNKGRE